MRRFSAALLCIIAATSVAASEPRKKPPLAKWQVTITSSVNGERAIVAAKQFSDQSRRLTHPGMDISVETEEARVTWLRGQRRIYSTSADVPFGNRYGKPSDDGDVSVIRLNGPAHVRRGDSIELEFLGVKSRFDIPVSEAFPASSRPKISFRLADDAQDIFTTDDTGPFDVDELIKTGADSNRLTVVMMGDGYRANENRNGQYLKDAKTAMSAFKIKDPWEQILKISNFYLVKVRSKQVGADDYCARDAARPCTRVTADTYFDSSFGLLGADRFLILSNRGIQRAIAAADKFVGVGSWDAIIVFVNSTKYGGTGGVLATTSMHVDAPEIAVHELGHTIGKLADEYEDPNPGYPTKITESNVDSNGTNPKWRAWLTPGVLLPTPEDDAYNDVVGAFEGGRYKTTGVFRPMRDCMMRSIGKPFCPVCQEAMLTKVLGQMNLYNRISPTNRGPFNLSERDRTFKYTRLPLTEGEFRTTWTVCGRIAGTDVNAVTISKDALQSKRSCSVSLKIDYTSPRLKSSNLTQTVTWMVQK